MIESTKAEAMVTHLQMLVERDKTSLAREIHDDLGGFLIASAMDVTNLRHRFAACDEDARRKFDRLSKMLNGAIDMMRRVTEELHPTLLDNVGLFAALRWQMKQICHRSNITCIQELPDAEPSLNHAAAITLFRVGQEALVVAESHPEVQQLDFGIKIDDDILVMQVVTDGAAGSSVNADRSDVALEFLRHRITAMGGDVTITYPTEGGLCLRTRVALADLHASQ